MAAKNSFEKYIEKHPWLEGASDTLGLPRNYHGKKVLDAIFQDMSGTEFAEKLKEDNKFFVKLYEDYNNSLDESKSDFKFYDNNTELTEILAKVEEKVYGKNAEDEEDNRSSNKKAKDNNSNKEQIDNNSNKEQIDNNSSDRRGNGRVLYFTIADYVEDKQGTVIAKNVRLQNDEYKMFCDVFNYVANFVNGKDKTIKDLMDFAKYANESYLRILTILTVFELRFNYLITPSKNDSQEHVLNIREDLERFVNKKFIKKRLNIIEDVYLFVTIPSEDYENAKKFAKKYPNPSAQEFVVAKMFQNNSKQLQEQAKQLLQTFGLGKEVIDNILDKFIKDGEFNKEYLEGFVQLILTTLTEAVIGISTDLTKYVENRAKQLLDITPITNIPIDALNEVMSNIMTPQDVIEFLKSQMSVDVQGEIIKQISGASSEKIAELQKKLQELHAKVDDTIGEFNRVAQEVLYNIDNGPEWCVEQIYKYKNVAFNKFINWADPYVTKVIKDKNEFIDDQIEWLYENALDIANEKIIWAQKFALDIIAQQIAKVKAKAMILVQSAILIVMGKLGL